LLPKKYRNTIKNNPDILKNSQKNRRITYDNNPKIMENAIKKYKETH